MFKELDRWTRVSKACGSAWDQNRRLAERQHGHLPDCLHEAIDVFVYRAELRNIMGLYGTFPCALHVAFFGHRSAVGTSTGYTPLFPFMVPNLLVACETDG